MMGDYKIITNNQPRLVLDWNQLTQRERAEFDYHNPDDGGDFIRYRGATYDLTEFTAVTDPELAPWQGMHTDTFFSAVVARWTDEDHVIMGLVLA